MSDVLRGIKASVERAMHGDYNERTVETGSIERLTAQPTGP